MERYLTMEARQKLEEERLIEEQKLKELNADDTNQRA
jgi:hypothetical protein